MKKLLELYLNEQKNEKIVIYTTTEGLELTGELTLIEVYFVSSNYNFCLHRDVFNEKIVGLPNMLHKLVQNQLQLHESIKKNIGYYSNQYVKNNKCKDIVKIESENGYKYWVGAYYNVFYSPDKGEPDSWLYNKKNGDISFELTPFYPWFYQDPDPEEGEVFITYRDWMKTYKPYVVRTIPKKAAEQWIKQLDELIEIVLKVSATLPCAGLLDCICCVQEEKANA